ncbi:hypothetical protein ACFFGV_14320 [Pontibacillus salicampi]|uniref:Uncharacterized protein n=1 Tax=Pontibacillus salicampi TaxID=1449801 RepID=A0ABV6LQZ6_9BACI
MSEKKRVIKVDEVIIQADNVVIEPTRKRYDREEEAEDDREYRRGPFDNLFGPGPRSVEAAEAEEEEKDEVEEVEEDKGDDEEPERRPFSWI